MSARWLGFFLVVVAVAITMVVRRRVPGAFSRLGRTTLGAVAASVSACKQACVGLAAEATSLACLLAELLAQEVPNAVVAITGAVVTVVGCGVVVALVEAEFRLDGGRVDAVCVQTLADRTSELHVARRPLTLEVVVHLHVQGSNQLGIAELPDVEVVAADDSREIQDIVLDILNIDAGWSSL